MRYINLGETYENIEINVGDTVTWENTDPSNAYTVTSSFGLDVELYPDESASHSFSDVGTFSYTIEGDTYSITVSAAEEEEEEAPGEEEEEGGGDVTIEIYQSGETYENIEINVGDTVTWENLDPDTVHTVTSSFGLDVELYPEDTASHNFPDVGTFSYTIEGDTYSITVLAAEEEEAPVECDKFDVDCLLNGTIKKSERQILPDDPNYGDSVVVDKSISGTTLILRILQFVLGFVAGVAILIIIFAGFMYITSQGDEGTDW